MNNWIVIRSFTNRKQCWYVRVSNLQIAAKGLGLELSTCECNGVPNIIQDWLNEHFPSDRISVEL